MKTTNVLNFTIVLQRVIASTILKMMIEILLNIIIEKTMTTLIKKVSTKIIKIHTNNSNQFLRRRKV